jgi:hypothetical protein
VKEGFTAATDRTSCLSFGAPVYVYVAAAQPELGMLILGDVDAALAALHRGDLGAFRFEKNHFERAEWTKTLYALTRAKFDRLQIRSRPVGPRSGTWPKPLGHWSPFSIVGFAGAASSC